MSFGPKNEKERTVFAVERFRVRLQARIRVLMRQQGMTQSELAKRLGVTSARVSQLLSSRGNMTIRVLAEIYHALGCDLDAP